MHPSPAWQAFHVRHFDDAARRAWFTEALAFGHVPTFQLALQDRTAQEDAWTQLAWGEDEAGWQRRHRVQYLTPGAARMFDASRRFREARALADEASPQASDREIPTDALPDTPCSETSAEDLAALRARALEAMSKGRATGATTEGTSKSGSYDACHPYSRLYIQEDERALLVGIRRHVGGYGAPACAACPCVAPERLRTLRIERPDHSFT